MKRFLIYFLLCIVVLAVFVPWLNANINTIEKTEPVPLLENDGGNQYQNSPVAIYAKFGILFSMTSSFYAEEDKSGDYAVIEPLIELKTEDKELKKARIKKTPSGIEFSWKINIKDNGENVRTQIAYRFFYYKKGNRINCDATEKGDTWYERLGLTKKDIKDCNLTKNKIKKIGEQGLASLIGYCESRLWASTSIEGRYTGVSTLDVTGIGYKFS